MPSAQNTSKLYKKKKKKLKNKNKSETPLDNVKLLRWKELITPSEQNKIQY